jgi:exonuclease SbcC
LVSSPRSALRYGPCRTLSHASDGNEGFGSLDAETLDVAIDALEALQGKGRRIGVITHVAAMIDRIAVQVRVERCGNGRSTVRVTDGAAPV